MRGLGREPKVFGLRAQHADRCPIGIAARLSTSTRLSIVSSMGRAVEYARRAAFTRKTVVRTWSVKDGMIGLAGDEEIIDGAVDKGAATAVVVIRSAK